MLLIADPVLKKTRHVCISAPQKLNAEVIYIFILQFNITCSCIFSLGTFFTKGHVSDILNQDLTFLILCLLLKQVPITLILESLCVRVHERAIAEHSLKHCVTLNIKVPLTNTNQIKSVSQIIWFTKDHKSNLSSPRQPFCSNPDHIYIYIYILHL